MAEFLELRIVTPQEIFFEGIVRNVYFESPKGITGILIDHHPYIAAVNEGIVSYADLEEKEHLLYTSGGFIRCQQNHIEMVVNQIEDKKRMNLKELEKELKECRRKIESAVKGELSPEELEKNLRLERVLASKIRVASANN